MIEESKNIFFFGVLPWGWKFSDLRKFGSEVWRNGNLWRLRFCISQNSVDESHKIAKRSSKLRGIKIIETRELVSCHSARSSFSLRTIPETKENNFSSCLDGDWSEWKAGRIASERRVQVNKLASLHFKHFRKVQRVVRRANVKEDSLLIRLVQVPTARSEGKWEVFCLTVREMRGNIPWERANVCWIYAAWEEISRRSPALNSRSLTPASSSEWNFPARSILHRSLIN